jgi:hypothetical protein
VKERDKLPNDEVIPPKKRGEPPCSKKDNKPVELHHRNQDPKGSIDEMHPSDHRYSPNYKDNHSDNGPSDIDRNTFSTWKKGYWKRQWDSGRWNN